MEITEILSPDGENLGHTDYTDYADWFFAGVKNCFGDVTNCVGGGYYRGGETRD